MEGADCVTKILIVGENSYIGNAFEGYVLGKFSIEKVSSREGVYKNADFAGADCVLFCAGIAHRKAPDFLHFEVNCDLALEVAAAAKVNGVGQFVYLSSAAALWPSNAYGKSKLKAEVELAKLRAENFIVTIVRPPMVYGFGCKGDFERLLGLARKMPIFPNIKNKRSMIYIENLNWFLVQMIECRMGGVFFPQNERAVCTSDMVRAMGTCLGRKIWITRVFNPLVYMFLWVPVVRKLFGDLAAESSEFERVGEVGFEESVNKSLSRQTP